MTAALPPGVPRKRPGPKPQGFGPERYLRLPQPLDRQLVQLAKGTERTTVDLVRDAVARYLQAEGESVA